MEQRTRDMEAIIREEKRLVAAESHAEAWAEGASAGIEPEIMAEAALATALTELFRSGGENAVLTLLEKMREKAVAGEFEAARLTH